MPPLLTFAMPPAGRPKLPPGEKRVTYSNKLRPGTIAELHYIAKEMEMNAAQVLEELINREAKRIRRQ